MGHSDAGSSAVEKHVLIFGPHHSGTNAMVGYLERFFDVNVFPASEPARHQGSLRLPSGQALWKHMKPLPNTVLNILPDMVLNTHDAVVLCVVRDPASYLIAMSEDA